MTIGDRDRTIFSKLTSWGNNLNRLFKAKQLRPIEKAIEPSRNSLMTWRLDNKLKLDKRITR